MPFMHDIPAAPLYKAYDIPTAPLYKSDTPHNLFGDIKIKENIMNITSPEEDMMTSRITAAAFFKLPHFEKDRAILTKYLTGWLSRDSTKKLIFIENLITKSNKPFVSINIIDRINKTQKKDREKKWDLIWEGLPQNYKELIRLKIHRVSDGSSKFPAPALLQYGRDDDIKKK